MIPGPLTDADKDAALWQAIQRNMIERYDTRWGTAEAAKRIKAGEFRCGVGYAFGSGGPCEDGPYSWENVNGEHRPVAGDWFVRDLNGTPKGVTVTVERCRHPNPHKDDDGHWTTGREEGDDYQRETIREGLMSWNELANRATLTILRLRREAGARDLEPLPGQQLTLV